MPNYGCPVSIGRGSLSKEDALVSARIEARYGDAPRDRPVNVACRTMDGKVETFNVKPASDEELLALRIG